MIWRKIFNQKGEVTILAAAAVAWAVIGVVFLFSSLFDSLPEKKVNQQPASVQGEMNPGQKEMERQYYQQNYMDQQRQFNNFQQWGR